MILYFDLDQKKLVNPPGYGGVVRTYDFIRGDYTPLEVHFLKAGVDVTDVTGIVAVIKEAPGAASPALAIAMPGDWENPDGQTYFIAAFNLNGSALDALLGTSTKKSFLFEITCHQGGVGPITSQLVKAVVGGDLYRGDEASPDIDRTPDDDWVAHGHAQTLTTPQKVQAQENIGANPIEIFESLPIDQPAEPNTFVVISGTIFPELDGLVFVRGTISGKNAYSTTGGDPDEETPVIQWDGTKWVIGIWDAGAPVPAWTSTEDVATPDLVTTWTPESGVTGALDVSAGSTYGTDPVMIGRSAIVTHSDGTFSEWSAVSISPHQWLPRTAGIILNRDTGLYERWFVRDSTLQSELLPDQ